MEALLSVFSVSDRYQYRRLWIVKIHICSLATMAAARKLAFLAGFLTERLRECCAEEELQSGKVREVVSPAARPPPQGWSGGLWGLRILLVDRRK
jgi:hypothetical protein